MTQLERLIGGLVEFQSKYPNGMMFLHPDTEAVLMADPQSKLNNETMWKYGWKKDDKKDPALSDCWMLRL